MKPATQGLLLGFLGAVLVRLSIGGTYVRYVATWMHWPLLATGIALLLLAVRQIGLSARRPIPGAEHDDRPHGHRVPLVTWLALVPGLLVFIASPPPLGAYLAEQRAGDAAQAPHQSTFPPLPASSTPVEVPLNYFTWRSKTDDGVTIRDRQVQLTGFVSHDKDGHWYVTRLEISCCAADAWVWRVRVDGPPSPARNSWVAVVGTWEPGTGLTVENPPAVTSTSVIPIRKPANEYL